jgi:D-inositol-3-phosphate glycosyltransferase
VVDGESGFLHPFGDVAAVARSIARLADSPELTRALGEGGRQRAESHFTADLVVPEYEALYRRVGR